MRWSGRLLSVAVALAIVVGGLLVAGEVVVTGVRHRPWLVPHDQWYATGRTHPWSAASVQWVCLALAAAGALLLLAALVPRRPGVLPLRREPGTAPADIDRASLEGSLARTVEGVDGVDRASVRARPKGTQVVARTARRDPGDLQARVRSAVAQRLATVGVAPQDGAGGGGELAVTVDVRPLDRARRRRAGRR